MELLGKNITNFKKSKGNGFTNVIAYDILIQMLDCIEFVHNKGYIHRDIKPSNFVMCQEEKKVFIVDFGLAKHHLNKRGVVVPARKHAEFRGTLVYASMNAHDKIDLSRRDDLFSFFFVVLELLTEAMPWRTFSDDKEKIANRKRECLSNPEKELLCNNPHRKEILSILYHIQSLQYQDRPDYEFIRGVLKGIWSKELRSTTLNEKAQIANSVVDSNNYGNINININYNEMLNQIQSHQSYMALLTKFLEINQSLLCIKKEINDNINLTVLGLLQEQYNQGNMGNNAGNTTQLLKKKRVRNDSENQNQVETDTASKRDTQDIFVQNNQTDLLSQMYCLEAYTKYFTQMQQEYLNRYTQMYCLWK